MTCELRACCKRPTACFISTASAPRGRFIGGDEAPLIAKLDALPEVSRGTAVHESGHAVVLHSFGRSLDYATLFGNPHVAHADEQHGLSSIQQIAAKMAGPSAEYAHRGIHATLFSEQLSDFFARVDDLVFGGCDECGAALIATVESNRTGVDRTWLFREGERLANELVRMPPLRGAITALADALLDSGRLDGTAVHQLVEAFVGFGAHRTPIIK